MPLTLEQQELLRKQFSRLGYIDDALDALVEAFSEDLSVINRNEVRAQARTFHRSQLDMEQIHSDVYSKMLN